MNIKKYIGNRAFYRTMLGVALPIMVQNGVSMFVNLLDNLMVGRLCTEALSGVSVVNQFLFIFNLMIFGAVSAAGIFMAQYHGYQDVEGERNTFRFKILISLGAGIIGTVALWVFSEPLISLFLKGETDVGDPALTLEYGKQYLFIMLWGLIPFSLSNVYASSMRETTDTVTPMIASIVSVATNFVLNGLLIFGLFGLPALGVRGAAIATVVARLTEMAILMIKTHAQPDRYPYIRGAFRSFGLPPKLAKEIIIRGMPLMLNELFWSISVTFCNQSYSTCSLSVVPAESIFNTLNGVFSVAYLAMGSAIGIMIGNLLGEGKLDEARDADRKMIAFSVACGLATGLLQAVCSGFFPLLYNTTDEVRSLATYMIIVSSVLAPFSAYTNGAYFTLRSGGQVLVTVLFDSVFMWTVVVPVVFCLSRFTPIGIHALFLVGQGAEALKAVLGFILLRRGTWVKQIVAEHE